MPGPAVHSVHLYDNSQSLISRLRGIVAPHLRNGGAVLLVATREHRSQLIIESHRCGLDLRTYVQEGRLLMLDAEEMLTTFMFRGMPDRELFVATLRDMLSLAPAHVMKKGPGLLIFGEMVAVLWAQGRKMAALRLEEMWNAALKDTAFRLHCAYPREQFLEAEETVICGVHDQSFAA